MNRDQDKITGVLAKHPFAVTLLLVLVILAGTGMQIDNNKVVFAIMLCGYVLIIGYGIYLRMSKKLTDKALIVLLFAMGFVLRAGYVLFSSIMVRQNDVGTFAEGVYNEWHSGYILYVRDNLTIADSDVRGMGQFYHPPFHYFVSAVFLKCYEIFLPKNTHNYEALQALSLLWSQFALIVLYKTVKLFGIKEENHVTAAGIIAAFPTFTLLSGSINNDILSILLYFTAFYFGLKWYKERTWKNIILSAVATGFGMMTKLSIGMIAFPLGFLFVVKLIRDLTDKSNKKAGLKTFANLCVFGVISVPLGLWYQIRNYLKFGVPITYVLRSDNIYQDVSRFSVTQRLFGFYGFPIEDYFINLGSDGEQDYNIFITTVKTALFGEENYRDDALMSLTGYFLLIAFLILIGVALIGLILTVVKLGKSDARWEKLSAIVLAVTMTASIITFSFKYPHICSMNFRYSTPLILSGTLFVCKTGEIKLKGANGEIVQKLIKGCSLAFFILSVVFYSVLWTYVKGEIAVVEPVW